MSAPVVIDLDQLRSGCRRCTLQDLCLPAGVGAVDLDRLDRIVRRRRPVQRGERLFRPGDALGSLYVARSGAFKTVTPTGDDREQVLGFHLPGELIGLDALGDGEHRCEAIALGTANVCEVPYDELSHVAAEVPGLQQQLLRVIGQSMGRDNDHAGMLVRKHADARVALFLHGLGERYRHIGTSATLFTLPMSREDISSFLGLAFETVSRGLTRLQEDGVIAVAGRRIEILSVPRLVQLAHGRDSVESRQRA